MKTITKLGAQGDVLFRRIDSLPDGAKAEPEASEYVVAHSETGHHHVAKSRGLKMYRDESDPLRSYLELRETTQVEHLRGFDTHETVELLAKIDGELAENEARKADAEPVYYEVIRQRQMTPEGWARVVD